MPVSVRYIVNDVGAAVEFYTAALGFKLDISLRPVSPDFHAAICFCC